MLVGDSVAAEVQMFCPLCRHVGKPDETASVRCNVRRFRDRRFAVWRCARCRSLHCEDVEDLSGYYEGYPIRNQELNYFSRAWYRVVLKRLVAAGLRKHHCLLDYGCNQGLFLRFLQENGYQNCSGFDPYVTRFSSPDVLKPHHYDFVVALDVIEHDIMPRDLFARLVSFMKADGRLCIETPNADGIDLGDTEEYLHALHMPYHVHILSQPALLALGTEHVLAPCAVYDRWYMDSWPPGTARRLFEPLMRYGGNDLDLGYEPPRLGIFFRHPSLCFYLFFGFLLPARKNDHTMVIFAARP